MKKAQFVKVDSFTDPDMAYMVVITPDGKYKCTCPDYIMRQRPCKHIEKVKREKSENKAKNND